MDYRSFTLRFIFGSILSLIIFINIFFYENYLPYFVLLIYSLICLEILLFFKQKKILILLYLIFSFLSFEYYLINSFNKYNILYLIILIISFDTFSYIFGSLFGKKKIIPKVSPNKTYTGLIFGYIFSLIFTYVFLSYFQNLSLFKYFLYTTIFIILSFIGDILESYFKRQSDIKNSSYFLPGHGGFFDRFDSFILCAFLLPYINLIL